MIIYIDYRKKEVFIVPPKCGNNIISTYLNLKINKKYTHKNIMYVLTNNNFKKIIIYRDIYDRFLSGFYEDLINNSCYLDIDLNFLEYCEFLEYCINNNIKNVSNLNVKYYNLDKKIWWGECGAQNYNIINNKGYIDGHMISQENCIKIYVDILIRRKSTNVYLLNIKDINKYLGINIYKYQKNYMINDDINFKTPIYILKTNRLFPTREIMINDKVKSIIDNLYNSDFIFLDNLKKKFNIIYPSDQDIKNTIDNIVDNIVDNIIINNILDILNST